MATASLGLSEFESELLPESELESEFESESEFELENPEMFGWSDIKSAASGAGKWVSDTWRDVGTHGTNARRVAIDVDKALWSGGMGLLAGGLLGPEAAPVGAAVGTGIGSAIFPPSAYEGEFESEFELSPIRRVYPDAMAEHMAHEATEAESEQEAAEHFLPLIPLVAGKLLPLAAKVLPKVAGKILPKLARRVLPRITRAVTKVTPQLTRGVSTITRTLYRRPQTRRLIRVVPNIARRTVARIARQAAAGRPVSPQAAVQVLRQQARQVIANPQQVAVTLRRSNALDRGYHRIAGIPWRPSPWMTAGPLVCPRCSFRWTNRLPASCRCCGQLITR
jgi:hypothetical protein